MARLTSEKIWGYEGMETVAVAGASGVIGGGVARLLTHYGVPVRALVRDASRAPILRGEHEVAVTDYANPRAVEALKGCRTLYMVSAHESADRLSAHKNFIDAAVEAGVERIVYASYLGANNKVHLPLSRDHYYTERHIKASGLSWTMLRSSFYAEVFEGYAGPERILRGPAADGRVSLVARADVVRSAVAAILGGDKHNGHTYEITGPASLSLREVAQALTDARGTRFDYVDESLEEAMASREVHGLTNWQLCAWISVYRSIAEGDVEKVSGDVQALTGAPPLRYEQVLHNEPFSIPGSSVLIPGEAAQRSPQATPVVRRPHAWGE